MEDTIIKRAYPFSTISTDRLVLRKFENKDLPCVIEAYSNINVVSPMFFECCDIEEYSKMFIETVLSDYASNKCTTWAICDKKTDVCMGAIEFHDISGLTQSAELGYWLCERFWNKGYAKEAAKAMVRYGFEYLKLHKICAKCSRTNKASAHVLKGVGLELEGITRDTVCFNSKYHDIALFGLINPADKQNARE